MWFYFILLCSSNGFSTRSIFQSNYPPRLTRTVESIRSIQIAPPASLGLITPIARDPVKIITESVYKRIPPAVLQRLFLTIPESPHLALGSFFCLQKQLSFEQGMGCSPVLVQRGFCVYLCAVGSHVRQKSSRAEAQNSYDTFHPCLPKG